MEQTYYNKFRLLLYEEGIKQQKVIFGKYLYNLPYGIAEVLRWFDKNDELTNHFLKRVDVANDKLFIDFEYPGADGISKFYHGEFILSKPLSEQESVMKQIYELAITLK